LHSLGARTPDGCFGCDLITGDAQTLAGDAAGPRQQNCRGKPEEAPEPKKSELFHDIHLK
jgi:hypothetical protein